MVILENGFRAFAEMNSRRRKTVRLRHLEQKVAFMKVEQALIPHFSKLHGQPAALHTEVIRKLLP